jgi:hypothetical protein
MLDLNTDVMEQLYEERTDFENKPTGNILSFDYKNFYDIISIDDQ